MIDISLAANFGVQCCKDLHGSKKYRTFAEAKKGRPLQRPAVQIAQIPSKEKQSVFCPVSRGAGTKKVQAPILGRLYLPQYSP